MQLVVRADGGPEIGYGHLVRTSALAREMLSLGHQVSYATTTPGSVGEVCLDEVNVFELPSRSNPRPFVEWLDEVQPDVVFTDAYPVDTDYQRTVREHTPLVVLQDDARHVVCADVFVNGNLYASAIDHEFDHPHPRTCLGTEYVLLREEIRTRAKEEPPWRESAERALVSMGGSDLIELTPTVLRAFDDVGLTVDVIVGPGFSERQEKEIRSTAEEVSADVRIRRNPDDLPERMFQADIAVTTASTTTYELLALGTPMICLPVADNQEPIATALCDRDLAEVLPPEADADGFRRAIEKYVNDTRIRRERRERGRELVDGRGSERVAAEVLSQADKNVEV